MIIITVARKPFEGSVIDNVTKWGTGGINLDKSRIKWGIGSDKPKEKPGRKRINGPIYGKANETINPPHPSGRFPSNVILTGNEEVLSKFPDTGNSSVRISEDKDVQRSTFSLGRTGITPRGHNDNGGSAARFFKQVKPK